jgi:hypothetical protein
VLIARSVAGVSGRTTPATLSSTRLSSVYLPPLDAVPEGLVIRETRGYAPEREGAMRAITRRNYQDVFYEELDPKVLRAPGDRYGSYFGDYVTEFRTIFNREFSPVWAGERTTGEAAKVARPKLEHLLKTGEET